MMSQNFSQVRRFFCGSVGPERCKSLRDVNVVCCTSGFQIYQLSPQFYGCCRHHAGFLFRLALPRDFVVLVFFKRCKKIQRRGTDGEVNHAGTSLGSWGGVSRRDTLLNVSAANKSCADVPSPSASQEYLYSARSGYQ